MALQSNGLSDLARRIVETNEHSAYIEMEAIICNPNNLEALLSQIGSSDALHFTFTEMMSKSIKNEKFCPINETKSDDNFKESTNKDEKEQAYSRMINTLCQSLINGSFQNKAYIRNSSIHLVAVCLKDLCQNPRNLSTFQDLLKGSLFPGFVMNKAFVSSINGQLELLKPSESLKEFFATDPIGNFLAYHNSAEIFCELIDLFTMQNSSHSYYEYRRHIYTFRNTYLAIVLNIAIDHYLIFAEEWQSRKQFSQDLFVLMNCTVSLLEKLWTYPFSLTLHEYSEDDGILSNSVSSGETYFPSYFRNVLCHTDFLRSILNYYVQLCKLNSSLQQHQTAIQNLLRVIGRTIGASAYTFNGDSERQKCRTLCVDMLISILGCQNSNDRYQIETTCDITNKVVDSFKTSDYGNRKEEVLFVIVNFCNKVILNCPIQIGDGDKNPFCKAFQILNSCMDNLSTEEKYQNFLNEKAQENFEIAISLFANPSYTQKAIEQFGFFSNQEIECFDEIFRVVVSKIYSRNNERNLSILQNAEVEKFSESALIFWMHFCATVLPSALANYESTKVILKYFKIAKSISQNQPNSGASIACLHFISEMTESVMYEMDAGSPSTTLWSNIQEIEGCTFQEFILYVIGLCKSQFMKQNSLLVGYAIEAFKGIFQRLRKFDDPKFASFYEEVKSLIGQIKTTVFNQPQFFKERTKLFHVISTIWVQSKDYKYIYEIYALVATDLNSELSSENLLRYMHDIRGLLQPIETSENFSIVAEMALQDLNKAFKVVLSKERIRQNFEDRKFLKAFCHMAQQFCSDHSRRISYNAQNQVPLLVHELFKPYLIEASNYDFPKCLVKIYAKFPELDPVEQLMPLNPSLKEKETVDFPLVVREYFQNIHRVPVQQLEMLYRYIEDKVEFMVDWWEEVVSRGLFPQISLAEVVASRIAITKRQKECLAKLIYHVGRHSSEYWDVSGFQDERNFVKWFLESYQGFNKS